VSHVWLIAAPWLVFLTGITWVLLRLRRTKRHKPASWVCGSAQRRLSQVVRHVTRRASADSVETKSPDNRS
jgi:hypothetical protein